MKTSHAVKLFFLGSILATSGLVALTVDSQTVTPPKLANIVNEMTDQLMDASKALAVERGLVNGLINNPFVKKKGQIETINSMREESSIAFIKLERSFEKVEDQTLVSTSKEHLTNMRNALGKVKQLRLKADNVIIAGWNDEALKAAWFPSISRLILATNTVTEDVISSAKGRLDEKTLSTIEVKHSLWEAAEYAGVERGALNAKISAGSPITQDDYIVLKKASDKINKAWTLVLSHKTDFGQDFENSLKQIQQTYFVRFSELRRDVLNAGMTESKYPLSSDQWFEAASEGIRLMNTAHKSLTEFTTQRINSAITTNQVKSWIYFVLMIIGSALACISLWFGYFSQTKDTETVSI